MSKLTTLRSALSATTALAGGALLLIATPAAAQNLPDTGNVTSVTSGLGGAAPGTTTPVFTPTPTPTGSNLRVDLKDNRTILTWGGTGFNTAFGSGVTFKDARATSGVTNRTDNIAVLNRDISGNASQLRGSLTSDANVAVYVINRNGIIIGTRSETGAPAIINTGSFIASTNDITNDNDFLNGSTSLRFGVAGQSWATIELAPESKITTAANSGTTGGRMGDLVLISNAIEGRSTMQGLTATGGDVGLIAASDVTMQNAPGSPLSFTIHHGALSNGNIVLAGTVSGRNVTLASTLAQGASGNPRIGSRAIIATGASVTDRGVVLTAGAQAPGVTFSTPASNTPGSAIGISGFVEAPQITSAKGISLRSADDIHSYGALAATGTLDIVAGDSLTAPSGLGTHAHRGADIAITAAGISGTQRFSSTTGDIRITGTGGGTIEVDNSTSARDFILDGTSGASLTGIHAARDIIATAPSLRAEGLSAGSISLASTEASSGVRLGQATTSSGGIDVLSQGTITVEGVIGSAGNFTMTAAGEVQVVRNVTVAGDYRITGNRISLGDYFGAGTDVTQSANGAVTFDAGNSMVSGASKFTLVANGDGVGGEAMTLTSTTGFDFRDTTLLKGGPARQSDIYFRTSGGYDWDLGGISARGVYSALDSAAFAAGLKANTRIWIHGALSLTDSLSIDAGTLFIDNAITVSSGNLDLRGSTLNVQRAFSASGDITLHATNTSGFITIGSLGSLSGTNVVLSTAGAFQNNRGANAITASGHWVIYSGSPGANNFNGLNSGNTALWNATLATRAPNTISGNRYVFAFQPTLTFSTLDFSKIYGTDLTGSTSLPYGVSGFQSGVANAFLADSAATTYSGTPLIGSAGLAERASVLGGPYSQTIGLGTLQALSGYAIVFAPSTGKLTVTPKALTGTVTVDSKTYDGNASATGTLSVTGVLTGDAVGTGGTTFAFDNKNAGTGKPVNVNVMLSGADGSNYSVILPANILADIFKKAITGTIHANSKTYDGNSAGSGTITLNGVVSGDQFFAIGSTFIFSDKNAANNKTVTVTGTTLVGADSGNYTLTLPATALASIFKKALTVNAASANDKTYDGTTAATGTLQFSGFVGGDSVGMTTPVFTFADKNAGTSKSVTISGVSLTGVNAGNYSFTVPTNLVATIFRKAISGTIAADSRQYDGTTAATGTITLNGTIQGDAIGTTGSVFTFSDKNAGTGKTVTVTGTTLSGADAGNYTLTLPASALADILQKALGLNIAVDNKTYDGTTSATGSASLTGVVSGDNVGITAGSYAFASKNAGTGRTVNVSGIALTGTDIGNYTLTVPATVLADILKKALTGTATANNKTYDGTTTTTGTVTLSGGAIGGDDVAVTGGTFNFADKNAGTGKSVTVTGTLSGADAGNYTLTISSGVVADILKKALSGTIAANNKTYDGTTTGSGSVTLSGAVSGDTVGTSGSVFTFSDKNAGTGKTVTVTGTTLSGTDAGNYTLTLPASVVADIFMKAISGTIAANSKTYDGTTAGSGSVTLSGTVAGDNIGTSGSVFTFSDKNAGMGKTVTVTGTALSGTDAGNYTLTLPASALADILKKALTANVTADSKTYDGTTAGSGSVTLSGTVAGDNIGTSGSVFTFSDKNAGTGKTVTVTGTALSGADAGNYTLTIPASVIADIFKKALSGTIAANSKTYDGTTAGSGSVTLSGAVSGDTVGTSGSVFTFSDKNAGAGKTVTVTGTTLSGTDAGNYTLTLPASAVADILKKALTGSIAANSKTYDGTTTGSGTVTLSGAVSGDSIGTSGSVFTFSDKNAGAGKTVTVTGTTLSGADAGNYTLTLPASAIADILRKALTINFTADSKTYDGTTAATGTATLAGGVVSGDSVAVSGGSFAFADKNAGTGKAVNVGGVTLTGADAENYSFAIPASLVADIFKKAITGSVTVNNKTYDGNATGSGTITLNDVLSGDTVTTSGSTFTFADKNAGARKAVSVTAVLGGADGGNYSVTLPASVVADIFKKAITGTVTINSRAYDGTTAATGTVALNGAVAGDNVGTTGSVFAFADKNAGTGKAVSITGTMLSGTDAGNYTLTVPASALGDITRRQLTITPGAGQSKDQGEADPLLTYSITGGSLVTGEQISGALGREPGELPGNYAILIGTLSAGSNYALDLAADTFAIFARITDSGELQALKVVTLPAQIADLGGSAGDIVIEEEDICAADEACTTGN